MKKNFKNIGCCLVSLFSLLSVTIQAQDFEKLINLRGEWRFSIISSDNWRSETFNDSDWDIVNVPSPWENEGYHGFNGFGFYRKTFFVPEGTDKLGNYLYLGFIDDADIVYLNGVKIGSSGSFPPKFYSAYNAFRKYRIPTGILKEGKKNTIAVQVYDVDEAGGIVSGDVGIYGERDPMKIDVDLVGEWKFRPGDNDKYRLPNYDDSSWDDIMVPGTWEEQGNIRLDGFAWYRKQVYIPASLKGKMIVLLLGSIDDFDQTFLNGKKVGQIGDFEHEKPRSWYGYKDAWKDKRAYYITPENFVAGKVNTIAVRVFDIHEDGGMYKGPVAIIEKDKYIAYWRSKKN